MLTVYLSNKYIRIVTGDHASGKVSIRGMYYTIDTTGCLVNGSIVDEESLLELLREQWEVQNLPKKDVYLVLDSNQFTAKVVQVPMLNEKKMMEYLSREFTDVGRISSPVYGYFPLNGGDKKAKIRQVFAMAAPRDYAIQFVELFAKLGVKLSGIECANGSMIRLLDKMEQLRGKTCIVQFVDEMNLTNALLVEGRYETFNKKRLFSEPGTPGYAVETARAVSNLIQFAKAQNIPQKITDVYVAGLSDEDCLVYEDSIAQINPDLGVEKLESSKHFTYAKTNDPYISFANFALAIGGMLKTDPKTNVAAQIKYTPEQIEKRKARRKITVPVGAVIGVLVLVSLVLLVRKIMLTSELKTLQDYNQSDSVLEACQEYDAAQERMSAISAIHTGMESLGIELGEYPLVDSTVENIIASCAEGLVSAQISSYDSTTGILSFNTSAGDVEQINQFIALLMEEEIFASVDYTGYSQNQDGDWSVKVNCTMAPVQQEVAGE